MPFQPPSRISDVLALHRDTLVNCIGVTIAESLESAIAQNGNRLDEIWMLYSFYYRGLPVLERRLNTILNPSSVRVTISGILCHKNPVVEFEYEREVYPQPRQRALFGQSPQPRMESVTGRCELADIAFLATYGGRLPSGGIGNAMLTQTKRDLDDLGTNRDQFALYREVRAFNYTSSAYSKAARELPPKDQFALAHWAFAEERRFHSFSGGSLLGHPLNDGWRPIAWGLYQLLSGIVGKGFYIPQDSDLWWSRIIFDLIEITCQKATTCKNVYGQRLSGLRGNDAQAVVREVLTNRGGYVIKNSFGRIFSGWNHLNLSLLGQMLQAPKKQYDPLELLLEMRRNDDGPPTKDRELDPEYDGGGSFVIIDLEDQLESAVPKPKPRIIRKR